MIVRVHRLLLVVFGLLPRPVRRSIVRGVSPRYTVGAMCVIERDDGRLLLIRQSYRKRWGVPGGLLKRREAPAAAAVREVAEEVGLAIELVGEPMPVVIPELHRVDVIFRARPADGADPDTARPTSPEIVEVRWVAPTELPELQDETADAVRAMARASLRPAARPLAR